MMRPRTYAVLVIALCAAAVVEGEADGLELVSAMGSREILRSAPPAEGIHTQKSQTATTGTTA